MADVTSKSFLNDIRDWGVSVGKQLFENVLFGKKAPAGGTGTKEGGTVTIDPSGLKKWLPYILIGAALVGALFLFKKRK